MQAIYFNQRGRWEEGAEWRVQLGMGIEERLKGEAKVVFLGVITLLYIRICIC